jgi:hypothetical protein
MDKNRPNGYKINQNHLLQVPPKFTQIRNFGLKICHLATLLVRLLCIKLRWRHWNDFCFDGRLAGWPEWMNFRLPGGCLLFTVVICLYKSSANYRAIFSRGKSSILFFANNGLGNSSSSSSFLECCFHRMDRPVE